MLFHASFYTVHACTVRYSFIICNGLLLVQYTHTYMYILDLYTLNLHTYTCILVQLTYVRTYVYPYYILIFFQRRFYPSMIADTVNYCSM